VSLIIRIRRLRKKFCGRFFCGDFIRTVLPFECDISNDDNPKGIVRCNSPLTYDSREKTIVFSSTGELRGKICSPVVGKKTDFLDKQCSLWPRPYDARHCAEEAPGLKERLV